MSSCEGMKDERTVHVEPQRQVGWSVQHGEFGGQQLRLGHRSDWGFLYDMYDTLFLEHRRKNRMPGVGRILASLSAQWVYGSSDSGKRGASPMRAVWQGNASLDDLQNSPHSSLFLGFSCGFCRSSPRVSS